LRLERAILREIQRLKAERRPGALAVVVECAGSAPRKEGSKMIVRADGSTAGSVGGGCMEAAVVQASVMAMRDGRPVTARFELDGSSGGLVCGGRVLVYIEPILPEPQLVVLGAGHVGRALCRAGDFAGLEVTVVDNRKEYARRDLLEGAEKVLVSEFPTAFSGIAADSRTYVVVATRGHNHDMEALRAALATPAGYVALLGSRRKRALVLRALREEGFGEEDIARVRTPAGLPIGALTPEEIAISIIAEIVEVRRKDVSSRCLSHRSGGRVLQEDGLPQAGSAGWGEAGRQGLR